ncbi:Oidioi.mRNA.OKI2018_I69.chr1.g2045.t1.cds [Oikopleura dioica]|uniref:Oidioi.mRNA.OKI2018_I69.chr1.g2045.t1.cds n=1 Tax=Oikopleura dioica TaxID=34765 RepID=A0ABN7SPV4_OIKDI|nr:Oidioi.mRNA.OKI2018_I69.chr1.g2045.t1.cds [Oikopleura dioica]
MLIRIISRFALIQRIYAEDDGERHFAVQEKMGLGVDPSQNCHFDQLPYLANGQYACEDRGTFAHGSVCDFRCQANMDSFEVKCHCLVKLRMILNTEVARNFYVPSPDGCFWKIQTDEATCPRPRFRVSSPIARLKVAQPGAENWSEDQEESSGDSEQSRVSTLEVELEESSRSIDLQGDKIDELAAKIELLENKEKELEIENEKLKRGFHDVVFENSLARALLLQNVHAAQSSQVEQNLRFMKSLEDRLKAYEHQQREPIIEIKRDFIKLKQEVTDNQVPLEEIVDLKELGNFIQQRVLSYLLRFQKVNYLRIANLLSFVFISFSSFETHYQLQSTPKIEELNAITEK